MEPGDKVHVIEKVSVRIDPSFGSLSNAPIFEIGPELIGTLVSLGESNTQVEFPIIPGLTLKVVVVPSNLTTGKVEETYSEPWFIGAREDLERGYNSN